MSCACVSLPAHDIELLSQCLILAFHLDNRRPSLAASRATSTYSRAWISIGLISISVKLHSLEYAYAGARLVCLLSSLRFRSTRRHIHTKISTPCSPSMRMDYELNGDGCSNVQSGRHPKQRLGATNTVPLSHIINFNTESLDQL